MTAVMSIPEDDLEFRGETPWDGFGEALPENASLDDWQKAAGLDWQLERSPVMCMQNGVPVTVPNSDVLYRSDNGKPLSIVSSSYKVVQPCDVLHFFVDLIGKFNYTLEAAGCLHEGRRIWVMARTGHECEVVKNDKVKSYLLLSTSCDGSLATTALFTSIRMVCNNMLQYCLDESKKNAVKVRHTSVFDPNSIKEDLGIYVNELSQSFDGFMDDMKRMAKKSLSDEQVETILAQLFADSKSSKPVTELKGYQKIMELFNGTGRGAKEDGVHGTAWGLINAVTEYADYYAQARSRSNRLHNAWFGRTANMKEKAVQLVMKA